MTVKKPLLLLLILVAASNSTIQVGYAQAVANAQIHGIVEDASGAIVAGAQIKATQVETGRIETTVSAANGLYSFVNLPVGEYKVEAEAAAFKTYVQSNIVLQVGSNVLINIALAVGSTSEHIDVSADAEREELAEDTAVESIARDLRSKEKKS